MDTEFPAFINKAAVNILVPVSADARLPFSQVHTQGRTAGTCVSAFVFTFSSLKWLYHFTKPSEIYTAFGVVIAFNYTPIHCEVKSVDVFIPQFLDDSSHEQSPCFLVDSVSSQ